MKAGLRQMRTPARRSGSKTARAARSMTRESLDARHEQADVEAARDARRERAQDAAIGDEVRVGEHDARPALARGVQARAPDHEAVAQLAVRDDGDARLARGGQLAEALGREARPLARAPVPGREERGLERRDGGALEAHGGVVPAAAARLGLEPLVGDVEPAREGDEPVAHQRLAVVAPPQLPEAPLPEARPVVRDRVHAARAQPLEEGRGRVAAADEVVEQAHGDAAAPPPRAARSAKRRPIESSLKMYISSETRVRAASMAASHAGNASRPLRSRRTAFPATSVSGSSM